MKKKPILLYLFLSLSIIFVLSGCENNGDSSLEEPIKLDAMIDMIINSPNISETVTVYTDGEKYQDKVFQRDGDFIYSMFDVVDDEKVELRVSFEDEARIGYQHNLDQDCWMYTTLTDSQFYHIAQTHTTTPMLPDSIEMLWFDQEDNVYTLKKAYYDALKDEVAMTGHFDHYEFTLTDDTLKLNVKVVQNFEFVEYQILYSHVGSTIVSVDNLDTCDIPTE